MSQPLNLPLIRRARQEARDAGLAGPDQVSRLLATLLAIAEALTVVMSKRQPLGGQPVSGRLVVAMAGALLLATAASSFIGYRVGRADLVADCARRAFLTEEGIACVLWPAAPGKSAAR